METQLWQPNRTEPNRTEIIHDLENNFIKNKLLELRNIFPEAFCEDQIDWEKLKLILGADNLAHQNERYQLNWAGKTDAYCTLQAPTFNTLSPCQTESVDFDRTQNIFIEAENLEALKILQKAYAGSVKMIYIDPPYNTGSDSFIYPDKFSETREEYVRRVGDKDADGYLKRDEKWQKNPKESGRYHSNWLSMMLPRLHLARTLLRDDGVIFISIDDNEQAQLKLLCDEVFGAENFVAEFIWDKQHSQQQGLFKTYHEYVFLYAKNLTQHKNISGGVGIIDAGALKKISKSNPASEFVFPAGVKFEAQDGTEFTNTYGDSEKVTVVSGRLKAKDGRTEEEVILSAGWTQKNQMISFFNGYETFDSKGQKIIEFYFSSTGKLKCRKNRSSITPPSLLPKYGMSSVHTENLSALLNGQYFDNPKPIPMLIDFIGWFCNESDLILDFFSGSGTTAHAVMQLNAEDGGNRRYICVQLPEETDEKSEARKAGFDTIAEIAKERIRRAGKQVSGSLKEGQSVDTGFKVFKLSESNFKQWRQLENGVDLEQQLRLAIDSVAEHATPENMLYELMLRLGCKLTGAVEHKNGVYWVTDEDTGKRIALLLEAADQTLIDEVIAAAPPKVVALDKWFDGNDALKSNTVLQMKDAGIVFECV